MSCYLCSADEYRLRKGAVRDDETLRILECTRCGLVSLSSREHIGAGHYEDSGMHGQEPPAMVAWLRDTQVDDQRRFEMFQPLLANARVLDFGCGSGGFLQKVAAVAEEAAGVEPERRVREHWGDSLRLYSRLEDVGEDYDVITAFHVIEHLPDPRSVLRQLAARLKYGGRMIIEVPSSEDALLTLYENDAFQRFTYWSKHLFLFSAETLCRLASGAGLDVTAVRQFQRYPVSNHLYWLSRGLPGGHKRWAFLDTPALTQAYEASLAAMGRCDTLIAHLSRL
jgi:2-polyprenyl-3-methyl-5-hydroxy-6-metoxy-1,4-benzoquinol methylase